MFDSQFETNCNNVYASVHIYWRDFMSITQKRYAQYAQVIHRNTLWILWKKHGAFYKILRKLQLNNKILELC